MKKEIKRKCEESKWLHMAKTDPSSSHTVSLHAVSAPHRINTTTKT